NHFKVLLENDQVRVLDFQAKGGEKIPMHSHPAYLTYDISGSGTTKFTSPDGKTTESENKAGRTTWHQPATHASEATAEVHALLVELKTKPATKHEPRQWPRWRARSEEHTSELQSRGHLVCRLLLEKKKKRHLHEAHRAAL